MSELGQRLLVRIADEVRFLTAAIAMVEWDDPQRSVLEARRNAMRDVASWIGEQ